MNKKLLRQLNKKKVLFVKGSQVTRIRSELYSRESLVIPEDEAERSLQTLPSVDAVYLYDISPDLREKLVLQCAYLGIAVVYTLNKADALLGIGKHALGSSANRARSSAFSMSSYPWSPWSFSPRLWP